MVRMPIAARDPRRPGPRPDLAEQLVPVLDKIRARGGRITWPRVAILEAWIEGEHHVTVEDLEQRLRGTAPEIHQATLYRTLAALEELGVIYHLHLGHGPSVWHFAVADHEHLSCSECGIVVEVDAADFELLRASIADRYGFAVDTHHFVNQGLCGACAGEGHASDAQPAG